MHFVVDYVACLAEIDGVDHFVVAVVFVAIEVFGLSAVACGVDVLADVVWDGRGGNEGEVGGLT